MSKLIVVLGASSKQGWSVVNSLVNSGRYRVRAVTRRVDAPEFQSLKDKGVEFVSADTSKKEELKKVFEGAYGVYGMTPVLPPELQDFEIEVGKLQGEAAEEVGVKHFVWSGLENVEEITKGSYVVPHFTSKAKAESYIRSLAGLTVTGVYLAYFYTNFIEYYIPAKQPDGTLVFQAPISGETFIFSYFSDVNKKLFFLDPTTATGPVVLEVFDFPEKYSGKVIPIIGEDISIQEMANTFTKVTGIPSKVKSLTKEEFFALGFPPTFAEELHQMFEFSEKIGYFRKDRDLEESRRIHKSRSWESFLRETGWKGESFAEWKKRNLY